MQKAKVIEEFVAFNSDGEEINIVVGTEVIVLARVENSHVFASGVGYVSYFPFNSEADTIDSSLLQIVLNVPTIKAGE